MNLADGLIIHLRTISTIYTIIPKDEYSNNKYLLVFEQNERCMSSIPQWHDCGYYIVKMIKDLRCTYLKKVVVFPDRVK